MNNNLKQQSILKNNGGVSGAVRRFFMQSYSSAITASILLVLIFSIFTDSFLTEYNMFNLSRTAAVYGFIAGAQLMVATIGGMNLAVGAVGGLSCVILGECIQNLGLSSPVAIVITLLVGALCGFINGFLVVKLKLSGFIITLAMSFVYGGIATGLSHGYPYELTENFANLGRSRVGITSGLFVLMLIFVVVLAVFFHNTKFGRSILATGGNQSAARLSGISVDKVIIACNVLSCVLASVAALFWSSRTGSATSSTGSDWMLYSFAVCAIGGISLNGGNFTSIGFLCGSLILTMIRNGLTMLNVDIYYEEAFLGAVILLAVSVESLRTRLAQKL